MKPGRNDPCPCGSGKKYKKCCLHKDRVATPERNTWRVVQDGMQEVSRQLARYFHQSYGDQALVEAWSTFALDSGEGELELFDPQLREADAFTNWVFFTWAPDPAETIVADESLHGVIPAQAYLARHGNQLTPTVREYVQSWVDAPWSFYRVEQIGADQSLALRDMVTGLIHEAYAPDAGSRLQIGDEAYGFVVTVAGACLIGIMQPVSFMDQDLEALDILRERTASQATDTTPEALAAALPERDDEVRELYLLLTGMLAIPIVLQSVDTDPDGFTFHDLVFDIDSPRQAWDALKHLQPDDLDPSPLERDAAGEIRRISLLCRDPDDMSGDPEDRVLGSIDIEDQTLTVQTSGEHAARARDIIEDALGEHGRFRNEDAQDIDSVLESMAGDPEIMQMWDEEDAEDAYLELRHVYAAWPDIKHPALDERTPRQCIDTAEGRKQVAALLDAAEESERDADELTPERRRELFDSVRTKLGLPS